MNESGSFSSALFDPRAPCVLIAEAGVNHNGDLDLARRLVDVAADAGADAVKFQTFRAEKVASPAAPKADYQRLTTNPEESHGDMLRRLELAPEAHRELWDHCRARGLAFLSTPFDPESCDLLDELEVPAFKIASGEITNLLLLEHVARKGRPVILSTGMSDLEEVAQAVVVLSRAGCARPVLLHCVSTYPADPADANLRAMETLRRAFDLPVGFSDHTAGLAVALAAAALGARVIEKHFTLDRTLPGPDHRASLEPLELAELVAGIRAVEASLGTGIKAPQPSEANTRQVARRSLIAAQEIPSGTVLERGHLDALRPGTGIPPIDLDRVVGRRTRASLRAGQMITWEDLE